MLNICAALEEVVSTNWFSLIRPWRTPFVHTIDSRSYSPLTPLGILVKLYCPILFWSVQKVQLSVATRSMTPLPKYFMSCVFTVGSGLRGGDMT
jgi:hypothetical protein